VFRVERSVVIGRSVEDVFTYMADFEHEPEWNPVVMKTQKTSAGPLGVGTTYREVTRILGRRLEGTYEVTAFEHPTTFGIRSTSGPLAFAVHYTFQPVPGGTRFTGAGEVHPHGPLRLLEPLLARVIGGQIEAGLRRVKARLEAEPGA
jgi:hypothetical protein